MKNFKALLKISRPHFWPILPLIFLGGVKYSGGTYSLLVIIQALLLSFPFCIFLYGINDMYDKDSDRLNKRKGYSPAKEEDEDTLRKASFIAIFLLWICSAITQNWVNITGTLTLTFFSYAYSSPPFRLKEIPPQ